MAKPAQLDAQLEDAINQDMVGSEKADLESQPILDKDGFPLVPQPTSHKDDPLNWKPLLKIFVALQVSWLAFIGPMSSAVANPAFVTLGKAFGLTPKEASYQLTVYIVCAGVAPLFIAPLSNVYGRRPVYLLGNLLAGVCNVIAGNCSSWSGIIITRVFMGIGAGSTVAIGAATICDLYFMHERGVYMGIYTFFLTNGPHVAPLMGGFIAQYLNWESCFTIPGYIQLGTFLITLFCLPETLYHRNLNNNEYAPRSYPDLLLFKRNKAKHKTLSVKDFLKPVLMLKYLSVTIPALYYMTCFGYGTVLFALTGASLFGKLYHFTVAQTGLILSIPLLIGCLIGESSAGWVIDLMVRRYALRNDGHHKPEVRLNALWLAPLLPAGVIIVGVCFSHFKTTSWVGPAFGMGIACLGLQVSTTVVYTYATDCYKPQSAEIASILNVFRQVFSAVISFYALPLGDEISFQFGWLVFAMINVFFLIPMVFLTIFGEKWRSLKWQAPPASSNDI